MRGTAYDAPSSRLWAVILNEFLSFLIKPDPPRPTLFPYTTLFRSVKTVPEGPSAVKALSFGSQLDGIVICDSRGDRKSTRLNSSHTVISYAVFCLKKKNRSLVTLFASQRPAPRRGSRAARRTAARS